MFNRIINKLNIKETRFPIGNRVSGSGVLTLAFSLFLFFVFSSSALAATEFTSTIDPDNGAGTDYTSLSAWEQSVQTDLTASTTLVFAIIGHIGTTTDGATITGQTSGATGTVLHLASTTGQVLIENISGTFQNGEVISTGYGTSTIIATGTSAIAVAKCRSTGGSADTTAVVVDGWTTSSSTYIKIWTDPDDPYGRHDGKWSDEKYRIIVGGFNGIRVSDQHVKIDGLQIYMTSVSSNSYERAGIFIYGTGGGSDELYTVSNNIIRGITNNTLQWFDAVAIHTAGAGKLYIYNNIIYDFAGSHDDSIAIDNSDADFECYVYNNTFFNVNKGYYGNGGTSVILKNNISYSNVISYTGVDSSSDYNISSDGTAPGTHSLSSTTVKFLDATNYDFHLDPTDTVAINAGTSSPLTDSNLSFWNDIDGTARGSAWDIGADEVPVEYVSTICENTSAGGDCANLDYQSLYQWEDAVEVDLTASTTRVFSGTLTGTLNENDTVTLYENGTTTNVTAIVVATTSDQILLKETEFPAGNSVSNPITTASGSLWRLDASNYWTVEGATTTDDLGASPIAIAKIDGAWANAEVNEIGISGWDTDNDNYIKIYTTNLARHDGKWDDSKYRISVSNTGNDYDSCIYNGERYIRLDGLQINYDYNSSNIYGSALHLTIGAINSLDSKIRVSNNIVKGDIKNGGANGIGVYDNLPTVEIWNNIVYGFDRQSGQYQSCITLDTNSYAYNNTVYDCYYGISTKNSGATIKNNIVSSSTNSYAASSGPFSSNSEYNATDSSDDLGAGSDNITNATINFVSIASGTEDFHLKENNSDIINAGANLSNDQYLPLIFKEGVGGGYFDIDGAVRNPDNKGWDIGADEVPAKQYRSVGNDTSDLSNGGTVTISSTTRLATFSTAQPDNVGVGDVIQYGGTGYYKLAFITSRASSTEYSVQAYDTTAPTATTSASFAIYRAHLKLDDWANQGTGDINSGIDSSVTEEVFVNQNLVASNTTMMVPAYASDNGDDEAVTMNNWTTGAQNYIKVYTPVDSDEVGVTQRHNGTWDGGKYYLTGTNLLSLQDDFTYVDGLQLKRASTTGSTPAGISILNSNIYISNSIIVSDDLYGYSESRGIASVGGKSNIYIWNNIIYGWGNDDVVHDGYCIRMASPAYVYNNTIFNCNKGIRATGAVVNNLVFNTDDDFYSSGNMDNNASEDGDGDNAITLTNPINLFVDYQNNNVHLKSEAIQVIDTGTSTISLTGYGLRDNELNYDIDNNYRRTWDIGADEASINFVTTVKESNGDFSTLASWEAGVQSDLVATTTAVFTLASTSGTFVAGNTFVGQTSNATGTLVAFGSSSSQILLTSIQGDFTSGEQIADGNATGTLQDLGNPANAVAKIDGSWTSPDTTAVNIDGWTTGANNYIKIYTTDMARHNGKWDEGKYRIVRVGNSNVLLGYEDNLIIDGLQIEYAGSSDSKSGIGIASRGYNYINNVTIKNNIVKKSNDVGDNCTGIGLNYAKQHSIEIFNNIVYGFNKGIRLDGTVNDTLKYIYNNTLYDNNYGINRVRSGVVKNNLVINSHIQGYISSYTFDSDCDYNISFDSTAPGTHSKTNVTVSFVDVDNDDFHLSTTDTVAKNAGVDLSSESPFSENGATDIDGQDRYDISWDIGADEAPTVLYRSVGLHSGDLNTVNAVATVSVATNTASISFSDALPDNVGVGDAIEYGSPTQLAFITGRVSPNAYYIQSATGSAPVATTSVSTSVYRAHEHLDDWEDQVVGDVNQSIDTSLQASVLVGQDLVASNTAMFVPCYASTSADDLAVSVNGWNTATTSYIKIYTPVDSDEVGESQRHSGKWSEDVYRITNTIRSYEGNIYLDGLQVKKTLNTGNDEAIAFLNIGNNGSMGQISNSIIVGDVSGDANVDGINLNSTGDILNVYNCIIYNFDKNSSYGIRSVNGTTNVYNITVYNNNYGIRANGNIKNCVAFNNGDDFYSSSVPDYCASDDGDGTHAVSLASSTAVWKATFTDYEHNDFSIRDIASILYNSGTTIITVTDDIVGTARPYYEKYDIGAFEYNNRKPRHRFSPGGTFKIEGDVKFK